MGTGAKAHTKTGAGTRDVSNKQKADIAFQLRLRGLSYREIGRQLGVTEQRVHQIIQKELKILTERLNSNVEELRTIEDERLNVMLRALMPKAVRGEEAAIDRVLRIMDRRAKFYGLDTPVKQQIELDGNVYAIRLPDDFPDRPDAADADDSN